MYRKPIDKFSSYAKEDNAIESCYWWAKYKALYSDA